jgi:hypothetical protein
VGADNFAHPSPIDPSVCIHVARCITMERAISVEQDIAQDITLDIALDL